MSTSYHTQHSPFGAFASFTMGLHHAQGGFGQSLGGPASQNIYLGFREIAQKKWNLLPFFKSTQSLLATFVGEEETSTYKDPAKEFYDLLGTSIIDRKLSFSSDRWKVNDFEFAIHCPFEKVPDPSTWSEDEARRYTAPVLLAEICFDNTRGKNSVELIFGINEPAQPVRPLQDTAPDLRGFANTGKYGYATLPTDQVSTIQGLSVLNLEFCDTKGLHRIGSESAIIFTVPAGTRKSFPIALGFYQEGTATTGIDCHYFYTQYFKNLEEVLAFGLSERGRLISSSQHCDSLLSQSKLSPDQQWLLAQATHSYYGSSQFLLRTDNQLPLWVVNEGEYRMINTFDLTVDHLFFELEWHPWAMRNALDLFVSHYSYTDRIHTPEGNEAAGGISFCHDMGVANQFSPRSYSSYECYGLHGCFSHMTSEQLVNWILCAVTYTEKTGDFSWLKQNQKVLESCMDSLLQRDDPSPEMRDGLLKWDSNRCGLHGSEITTYDSLDISLGQARNNLYLAVKCWAAWILMESAFKSLGDESRQNHCGKHASLLCSTLCSHFESDTGFFPAVFEKGNRSRILPAVEGLVFPLYLGYKDALDRKGKFSCLLDKLEIHMKNSLTRGICLAQENGGWKLSSTSHNTWMSKIALAQHVTRVVFPLAYHGEAAASDAVHVAWEKSANTAPMAMCDQINCKNGDAIGSKYYPRIVTAILWLKE